MKKNVVIVGEASQWGNLLGAERELPVAQLSGYWY